jgi:serine/threonine protein kinase
MQLTSHDWLAGAELGHRFADVRLVRAGSRFTIYEGREVSANRSVVIKVPDESSAPWLHELLVHEATVLAAIGSHPHVVTFYQRTTLEDGRPALLLERCRGTLADAVQGDDEPMPAHEVTAVGIKLAGALETVHKHGVLHCDVRPGSVLLTEWGEPVLAGFDGCIEMADVGTRAPLHNLTPHTAPELLEGQDPTTASDVYGLASTLYELAAGRAAFRAYVGESPASVVVRVLSSPVVPITAPGVPLELSDLLTWALSPDPAERPPSPAWLAEELGRIERRQRWPRTRMISA